MNILYNKKTNRPVHIDLSKGVLSFNDGFTKTSFAIPLDYGYLDSYWRYLDDNWKDIFYAYNKVSFTKEDAIKYMEINNPNIEIRKVTKNIISNLSTLGIINNFISSANDSFEYDIILTNNENK